MNWIKTQVLIVAIFVLAGCTSISQPLSTYPSPTHVTITNAYPAPTQVSNMNAYPSPVGAIHPDEEIAQYYGEPDAAKVIVNGQEQIAGIGNVFWVESKVYSETVQYYGDAFGVVAPTQPIVTTAPFTITLRLPIHISPSQLEYVMYSVEDEDRWGYPKTKLEIETWNPPNSTPLRQLPLEVRQDITIGNTPDGLYILFVSAKWQGLGAVDYGFLLSVKSE